jgi:hypothetical protein
LSCNGCQNKTQKELKAEQTISVKLKRFDRELFAINPVNIEQGVLNLYKQYGAFYQSYAHDVLNMPEDPNDTLFIKPMKLLLSYKPLVELEQTVDSMYKDLTGVEKDLSHAMSVYKQEFPAANIPSFVTFISEFGYANITYDSSICIGLDMYMNKRYAEYYRAYEFPEFMIRKLQPEYIAPNAIKALFGNHDCRRKSTLFYQSPFAKFT